MNSDMTAKRKTPRKARSGAIERAAKREEQKQQGALDGRYRQQVVPDKKRYSRKRKPDPEE